MIVLVHETNAEAAEFTSVDAGAVKDQQGNPNPIATDSVS
jgi:hypothetical protein